MKQFLLPRQLFSLPLFTTLWPEDMEPCGGAHCILEAGARHGEWICTGCFAQTKENCC